MPEVGLKHVAVLTILRSGSEMLLVRRTKADALQNKYIPIGGHVEPFEAPRQAAIREVREETGLVIDAVTFRGVLVETSPTEYNWVTFIYSADVERFAPPECAEGVLEWVAVARLGALPTPETDAFIYAYVAREQPFVLNAEFDEEVRMVLLEEEHTGMVLADARPATRRPPRSGRAVE
jgi:8-oxo-dGTP diphosphatase